MPDYLEDFDDDFDDEFDDDFFDDEDEDDDESEDYDDDWFEVECPTCEEPLIIDDKALAEGFIQCPNCETKYSLDLSDDTVEADDGEE